VAAIKGIRGEHAPFDAHDAIAARIGHRTQRGGTRNVAWTGPGAAHQRRLVSDDLVLAEAKPAGTGRGRLYRVNTASPIFPELRQIVVKMLGGTALLRDVIEKNPAVDAAAIFGSVAAGTDRRTGRLSDIDLLLVFSDASTRDERFAVRTAISEIAERLNREISVQAHLRSEWEAGRSSNRVLRRIAEGALLMLKGTI
jgi:predicted nucleotidyltransferase